MSILKISYNVFATDNAFQGHILKQSVPATPLHVLDNNASHVQGRMSPAAWRNSVARGNAGAIEHNHASCLHTCSLTDAAVAVKSSVGTCSRRATVVAVSSKRCLALVFAKSISIASHNSRPITRKSTGAERVVHPTKKTENLIGIDRRKANAQRSKVRNPRQTVITVV